MPFYEYQCAACGTHHEVLRKITDPPLRKCPACGRSRLRRLVSAPVFRLKGGGWYETDFKADKEQKRNIAGDKEPAASEAPAAEKTKEAKPDAKSEAKTEATTETKPATAEGDAAGKKLDSRSTASQTRTLTPRSRAKRQSRGRRGPRR